LTQAGVGDKAILAFVEASEESFRLSAAEVVYLKAQGVSDQVLAAMLRRSRKTAPGHRETPAIAAEQNASQAPAVSTPATNSPGAGAAQAPTSYVQTMPVYSLFPAVHAASTPQPTYRGGGGAPTGLRGGGVAGTSSRGGSFGGSGFRDGGGGGGGGSVRGGGGVGGRR
jgi:translation initiation factor IF-2